MMVKVQESAVGTRVDPRSVECRLFFGSQKLTDYSSLVAMFYSESVTAWLRAKAGQPGTPRGE